MILTRSFCKTKYIIFFEVEVEVTVICSLDWPEASSVMRLVQGKMMWNSEMCLE
jgi:hypothetical protein